MLKNFKKFAFGIGITAAVLAGVVISAPHSFGDTVSTISQWLNNGSNAIYPRGGTATKVLVGQTTAVGTDKLQVTGNETVDNLTVSGICTGCSTGSILSVSGTANRITSTGGATPVIDISGSYIGQSSITTLGTISTGVWQGTKIDLAHGGTNADLSATGGTSQVLKQTSSGGAVTVGQLAASDLSNGTTGSGSVALSTTPTFTTSITDPLVIGGTGTTSPLTLRSTSGVGTTGADIIFQTGNNGATEAMRILNSGNVGIGTASPGTLLDIVTGQVLTVDTINSHAGVAMAIGVGPTTGAGAGGSLVISAGSSTVSGAGGDLTLKSGAVTNSSKVGDINIQIPDHPNGTSGTQGDINLIGGLGGTSGTSANGSKINLTAGSYRGTNTATAGSINLLSGNTSGATGTASGVITLTTATPASSTKSLGSGAISLTIGDAGANSFATGTAANSGVLGLFGGAGGAATAATGGTAGNGSDITLTSGVGGSATGGSGTRNGGNSGNIILTVSAAGTGATANGAAGTIQLMGAKVGIGTVAPTHSLTLNSTSNGTAIYNTADQTTNYERIVTQWSSNQAQILYQGGGTGAARTLAIGAQNPGSGNYVGLKVNRNAAPFVAFGTYNSSFAATGLTVTAGDVVRLWEDTGLVGPASGQVNIAAIRPTYNQTTSTGILNTDFLINRTETSLGTTPGAQRLIDAQVGGTTKFNVSNTGILSVATGYQIGGAASSGKILKADGTNFVASTETYAAPGTSGNVMTSDGTNWTSAAPSGGSTVPKSRVSTDFSNSGRFTNTTTGNGANGYGNVGLSNQVLAGGTGSQKNTFLLFDTTAVPIFDGNPTISFTLNVVRLASKTGTIYLGLGGITTASTGHTLTDKHFGFKIVATGSTASLYATQADGTTETASSALTTVADTDQLELVAVATSGTSINYYWRKNGGALSSATTLSTNLPSGNVSSYMQNSISSDNVAPVSTGINYQIGGMYYER